VRKGILRWLPVVIAVVFGAIQFIPVDRTNPPVETEFVAGPEAAAVLRRCCYDCHSNETVWPWYSRVAPVSWFVSDHINEGRLELNFSTWNRYADADRLKKLTKVRKQVEKGKMPLKSYLLIHRHAQLSPADISILATLAPTR